ncbi:hypothetical protein QYE76_002580 [Lolium multiflorum]|uniref:Uncharacterized protein n=1 Tax=Lolium multiflorum TaxID=4521 RepID=A0AAD8RMQ2_LOLMU|nr:hypothetical protein QYE76_002580 [Lolium multiflorum]
MGLAAAASLEGCSDIDDAIAMEMRDSTICEMSDSTICEISESTIRELECLHFESMSDAPSSMDDETPIMEKMYMVHEDDDITPCLLLEDEHGGHMEPTTSTTPTSYERDYKGTYMGVDDAMIPLVDMMICECLHELDDPIAMTYASFTFPCDTCDTPIVDHVELVAYDNISMPCYESFELLPLACNMSNNCSFLCVACNDDDDDDDDDARVVTTLPNNCSFHRFHVGAGFTGVAPHYIPPPTTFTCFLAPTGLNFSSRNLLDSAAGGTFMSITLGAATKLLDDMMINYSEWHTERTPQGKKVNSVEETSSLGDKIDAIMSMLANGRSHIDPNNVPLASLVAQEENVDVNFIKNNNFNNNAYRNNYGNNNFRPYPSNNGNGYGNSYNNNKSVPSGLEVMLKEFISTQTAFNKTVEEKLSKIDILASKVDSLDLDVDLLKLKVMPEEVQDARFSKTNAIQVQINDNIRLLAELHARWDREEKEKLAKENNVAKVWTITTTSNVDSSHVAAPPTINGKIIGVGNVSTPSAKRTKLPETAKTVVCDKTAEIFQNIGDNDSIAVEHNGLDFDDYHITEVIKFLQKLARSPNASAINLAFTKHITNALIKAREEKLKLEASIPRKLEDGWEPIIKMKFNDFECNALCDLGASISVMPKKIYDMLDLPPLKNCYLDVNLADNVKKKPLGRIDNAHYG